MELDNTTEKDYSEVQRNASENAADLHTTEPGNWDKWLPFLMFAYREVPRETWGFLPLKLVYGRYVRGLLKIVRKTFEEGEANYGHCSPSVTLH